MKILARGLAFLALVAGLADLLLRLPGGFLAPPEAARPTRGASGPARPVPAAEAPELAAGAAALLPAPPSPPPAASGAGPPPAPDAPVGLRASLVDGGILLEWSAPAGATGLRYRLTRWVGAGAAEVIHEGPETSWLDPVVCEGIPHQYRLRSLRDEEILPGRVLTRESPAVAIAVEPPPRWSWRLEGLDPDGRLLLVLAEPGRPPGPAAAAAPGREVPGTAWILDTVAFRETWVPVETRLPRFDALGRRVIINGRPADRVREDLESRILATVRLSDPCGTDWNLEMLLPRGSRLPEGE